MSGLTHRYQDGESADNRHEFRPVVKHSNSYATTSVPAEVPSMNDFESEGVNGSYAWRDPDSTAVPEGYDLNGIGAEPIHDSPPTMGREIREAEPLMTHSGIAEKGSDYNHPNEVGFRYRARFDGV